MRTLAVWLVDLLCRPIDWYLTRYDERLGGDDADE